MTNQPIRSQPDDIGRSFHFNQVADGTIEEVMRIERDMNGVLHVKISGELREAAKAEVDMRPPEGSPISSTWTDGIR